MIDVQKYLLSFKNREQAIENLTKNYGIIVKEYNKDLVVLNYNQIDSPRFNSITDDCRGLILSYDFTKVFSRPFTRFYNFGEGGEKTNKFDFSKSIVYEKLDGSLISIWKNPETKIWNASTRKMAYAEGQNMLGNTYHQVICKALNIDSKIVDFSNHINMLFSHSGLENIDEYTWIFELVSPETKIVKEYKEYALYLLAIRHKETGKYFIDIESIVKNINKISTKREIFKLPEVYHLDSIEDIMKTFKDFHATDEGFVCFNSVTEERVKCKNPNYLALSNMRCNGMLSLKRIATLVFANEYDEYLTYFEDDRVHFEPYIKAYEIMVKEINDYYNLYKDIKDQKDFAMTVNILPFSGILFEMRKGKTLADVIDKFGDDQKLNILDMFIDNKWKKLMNSNSKNNKKGKK